MDPLVDGVQRFPSLASAGLLHTGMEEDALEPDAGSGGRSEPRSWESPGSQPDRTRDCFVTNEAPLRFLELRILRKT